MTFISFEPLKEFQNIQDQLERYISEGGRARTGKYCPNADIKEIEESYSIMLELPGVGKEDVKITLEDNILTIEGEKRMPEDKGEVKFHRREIPFGVFNRRFTFPESVDSDSAEAEFKDGILKIVVQKLIKRSKKEVEIKLS